MSFESNNREADRLEKTAAVLRRSDHSNFRTDLFQAQCFEFEAKYWRSGDQVLWERAEQFRKLAASEEQREIAARSRGASACLQRSGRR